jgi:hypothetical protein
MVKQLILAKGTQSMLWNKIDKESAVKAVVESTYGLSKMIRSNASLRYIKTKS